MDPAVVDQEVRVLARCDRAVRRFLGVGELVALSEVVAKILVADVKDG
jgi:hypothetical protein